MIADLAQSIRQIVRVAMGMPANSVRPEAQLAGSGREMEHLATVKVIDESDRGWPSFEYSNVDGTKTSQVNENVDQIKQLMVSINFYRGGKADTAGMPLYTVEGMNDASRLAQRLRMTATRDLALSLGLLFVDASKPRDLTSLSGPAWRSRGQVDLRFNVVNRETSQINSIGSGSLTTTIQGPGAPLTDTTEVTT